MDWKQSATNSMTENVRVVRPRPRLELVSLRSVL